MINTWRVKWQEIPSAIWWLFGIKLSFRLNHPLVPPTSCVFSLTKRCNSRCLYCGIWEAPKPLEPSFDEISYVVEQLHALGVKELVLSGGEPLLRSDIVEIVSTATRLGLKVNLLTNGVRLDHPLIDDLVNAGIHTITLSLDSLNPDVYYKLRGIPFNAVGKALVALDTVDRSKTRVHLTCVVTMLNLDSLPDLVYYARDHKIGILFQPYNEIPGHSKPGLLPQPETVPLLEQAIAGVINLKREGAPVCSSEYYLHRIPQFMLDRRSLLQGFHCTAGYTGINIDTNLDVLPCWSLPSAGNFRVNDLRTIWKSRRFDQLRQRMKRLECPGCWLICHTERRPPTY